MLEDLAIERHRAAIYRTDLSRPIKLALEFEIINTKTTFFDGYPKNDFILNAINIYGFDNKMCLQYFFGNLARYMVT